MEWHGPNEAGGVPLGGVVGDSPLHLRQLGRHVVLLFDHILVLLDLDGLLELDGVGAFGDPAEGVRVIILRILRSLGIIGFAGISWLGAIRFFELVGDPIF